MEVLLNHGAEVDLPDKVSVCVSYCYLNSESVTSLFIKFAHLNEECAFKKIFAKSHACSGSFPVVRVFKGEGPATTFDPKRDIQILMNVLAKDCFKTSAFQRYYAHLACGILAVFCYENHVAYLIQFWQHGFK